MTDWASKASDQLIVVCGARLTAIGRAVNMAVFSLEPVEDSPALDDDVRSQFALHVQCGFRLLFEDRVALGFEDLLRPLGGAVREHYLTTVGDCDDPSVYDVRANALRPVLSRELIVVERVALERAGGLVVSLSGGFLLQVMPMNSYRGESWRFVHRGGSHVVWPPAAVG